MKMGMYTSEVYVFRSGGVSHYLDDTALIG